MWCSDCGGSYPLGVTECPHCGAHVRAAPFPLTERHRPIRDLGRVLAAFLSAITVGIIVLLGLRLAGIEPRPRYGSAAHVVGVLRNTVNWSEACFAVLFVVWFWQARVNAEQHGWRQRRARAWAFWGWLVPIVFLWIPFQLMGDIWRAGLPAEQQGRTAWPLVLWWTCFLLAGGGPGLIVPASIGWLRLADVALAAMSLVLIIARVSNGTLGSPVPGQPS